MEQDEPRECCFIARKAFLAFFFSFLPAFHTLSRVAGESKDLRAAICIGRASTLPVPTTAYGRSIQSKKAVVVFIWRELYPYLIPVTIPLGSC